MFGFMSSILGRLWGNVPESVVTAAITAAATPTPPTPPADDADSQGRRAEADMRRRMERRSEATRAEQARRPDPYRREPEPSPAAMPVFRLMDNGTVMSDDGQVLALEDGVPIKVNNWEMLVRQAAPPPAPAPRQTVAEIEAETARLRAETEALRARLDAPTTPDLDALRREAMAANDRHFAQFGIKPREPDAPDPAVVAILDGFARNGVRPPAPAVHLPVDPAAMMAEVREANDRHFAQFGIKPGVPAGVPS